MDETDKYTRHILDFLSKRINRKDVGYFLIDFQYRFSLDENTAKRHINFLTKKGLIKLDKDPTYNDKKMSITSEGERHLKYLKEQSTKEKEHNIMERQLELMERQNQTQENQLRIQNKLNTFTLYLVLATIVLALSDVFYIIKDLILNQSLKAIILIIVLTIMIGIVIKLMDFALNKKDEK